MTNAVKESIEKKVTMKKVLLIASCISFLLACPLTLRADPQGGFAYCEFNTQTQRHAGEWVIYFSDVFFLPLGRPGDIGKDWNDYIRSKYPVDPHDVQSCWGPRGATEAQAREDKAKRVKYDSYSGQIVETGWKPPQN
jgi:hypothetical protein